MVLDGGSNPHVSENSPTTYPWGFTDKHFIETDGGTYFGSSENIGLDYFVNNKETTWVVVWRAMIVTALDKGVPSSRQRNCTVGSKSRFLYATEMPPLDSHNVHAIWFDCVWQTMFLRIKSRDCHLMSRWRSSQRYRIVLVFGTTKLCRQLASRLFTNKSVDV